MKSFSQDYDALHGAPDACSPVPVAPVGLAHNRHRTAGSAEACRLCAGSLRRTGTVTSSQDTMPYRVLCQLCQSNGHCSHMRESKRLKEKDGGGVIRRIQKTIGIWPAQPAQIPIEIRCSRVLPTLPPRSGSPVDQAAFWTLTGRKYAHAIPECGSWRS